MGDQYLDIDMLDKEGNTVNLSDVIKPGQIYLLEISAPGVVRVGGIFLI